VDAETLEALRGSIAKWEAIVKGTGKDMGPDNCALCRKFHGDFRVDDEDGCEGCPVMLRTGAPGCSDTPYERYDNMEDDDPRKALAAQQELDFLKSLLPESDALQTPERSAP
jgi:hypothetical protein